MYTPEADYLAKISCIPSLDASYKLSTRLVLGNLSIVAEPLPGMVVDQFDAFKA